MQWREILWPWGAVKRQRNAIRWLESELVGAHARIRELEQSVRPRQPRDSRGRFMAYVRGDA